MPNHFACAWLCTNHVERVDSLYMNLDVATAIICWGVGRSQKGAQLIDSCWNVGSLGSLPVTILVIGARARG